MDEHTVENRGDTGSVWLLASSYLLWALAPDFAQGRCGYRRPAKWKLVVTGDPSLRRVALCGAKGGKGVQEMAEQ